MDASDAYDAILRTLRADPQKRIVDSAFDEVNFGSFHVGYEDRGDPRCILNDRGELVICLDLEGSRDCTTALASIHGVDEQTVLDALSL